MFEARDLMAEEELAEQQVCAAKSSHDGPKQVVLLQMLAQLKSTRLGTMMHSEYCDDELELLQEREETAKDDLLKAEAELERAMAQHKQLTEELNSVDEELAVVPEGVGRVTNLARLTAPPGIARPPRRGESEGDRTGGYADAGSGILPVAVSRE